MIRPCRCITLVRSNQPHDASFSRVRRTHFGWVLRLGRRRMLDDFDTGGWRPAISEPVPIHAKARRKTGRITFKRGRRATERPWGAHATHGRGVACPGAPLVAPIPPRGASSRLPCDAASLGTRRGGQASAASAAADAMLCAVVCAAGPATVLVPRQARVLEPWCPSRTSFNHGRHLRCST